MVEVDVAGKVTRKKTWSNGVGLVAMKRAEVGGRATFYVTGRERSATRATGSPWEATPWRAVQLAAYEALSKADAVAACSCMAYSMTRATDCSAEGFKMVRGNRSHFASLREGLWEPPGRSLYAPLRWKRGEKSQRRQLRPRLLRVEAHVHLAVHRRRGGEVLARLLLFAHGRPSGQRERDHTLKLWRGLFLGIAGIVCGLAIGLGYHWMGGPRQAAPLPPPDFVSP